MKNYMKLGVLGALLTQLPATFAQDWHANAPSGNPITGTEWLGCDATSTQPLRIKTVPDYAIDLYTSDIRRLTLLPDATTYTIGSFAGQVKDGCLLRSPDVDQFYTNGGPGPFSIDHVAAADDNAEQQYYRPWMDVGTTYTGNNDQGYVGQKAGEEVGQTDVVLHWGGDFEDAQKDHLRALFTTEYTSATTGAGSMEGLEFLRLWPAVDNDPHIGIGDFYAANINSGGLITEPTERVDVVNGRVRFRDLPENGGVAEGAYKVMVVDDTPTPSDERGVVKWVDPSVFVGADCDWAVENDGISGAGVEHDVYTAVGNSNVCPDATDAVGIGTPVPQYKLDVYHTAGTSGSPGGIRSQYNGPATGSSVGVLSVVNPENGTGMNAATAISGTVNKLENSGSGVTGGVYVNGSTATNLSQVDGVYGSVSVTVGNSTNGLVRGLRGAVSVNNGAQVKYAYGSIGTATIYSSSTAAAAYGMFGECKHYGTVPTSYGGFASSSWFNDAVITTSFGLKAESRPNTSVSTTVTDSYGLFGSASGGYQKNYAVVGDASAGALNVRGVYGKALTGANSYAVYSEGDQFSTTLGTWTTSDENLKTGIEDVENGLGLIMQLEPKSYMFRTDEFPYMHLAEEHQYGLLAQNLEAVLPEMVRTVHRPADLDSTGVELSPAMDFKAVKYEGLIPLLISAVKEQQATIAGQQAENTALQEAVEDMNEQLNDLAQTVGQMQQQLAACCAADGGQRTFPGAASTSAPLETDLRIIPNPVADRTELRYTVGTEGRVRLTITAPDGRTIRTQDEGLRAVGTYSYGWDTMALAPGTYHCTLFVNDELVVRKAVKVAGR